MFMFKYMNCSLTAEQHSLHVQEQLDAMGVPHSTMLEKSQLVDAILCEGGSSAGTCSICFEDYCNHDTLRVLPCKHRFHVQCVDKWLLGRSKRARAPSLACPLCNVAISS
jgi:Ring finger domain